MSLTTRCRSVYNPPEHFLVTANNRVIGPDYPYLVNGYWFPWFRAERITQMIQAKPKLTMDDFKAMHYDTHQPRRGQARPGPGRAQHAPGRADPWR